MWILKYAGLAHILQFCGSQEIYECGKGSLLKKNIWCEEVPYPNMMDILACLIKDLSLNFSNRIVEMVYLLHILPLLVKGSDFQK